MVGFRTFLIVVGAALAVYTAVLVSRYGMGLLPVFFGDIAAVGWPGQINLGFLCFLGLSAVCTAWRNGFPSAGLKFALVAFF